MSGLNWAGDSIAAQAIASGAGITWATGRPCIASAAARPASIAAMTDAVGPTIFITTPSMSFTSHCTSRTRAAFSIRSRATSAGVRPCVSSSPRESSTGGGEMMNDE